ncbi:putative sporulation protein YtaF [Clostridium saccharoperbutylacetonicum]|jgi:putative sporulation protein YtaF|uniref:Putative sporulation protein YtaF n=1 Tax=Clostridium saccharoperbutylacetonicum N1-4(HMT) TaxID=931276 RepID=M1LQW1_9CLOT|nr:sporulation membrane protein YtaF [Clostridium saccharoperbutylacetonicum]AGF55245.1 putative sporulation protein YtaF [Clostridium saccharoperbutylacetonicum N1-4(HMT)]NRT64044.1 putative sporulation protein YtaF [Clostridium saccharoperbutylacetonicum]NSB27411.1 putative sporulation protein YtaF [Clostridium saccharoperbutylacetonicum]NSB40900.1 putative sporulation protein YtaF [Clostridium saccharoperbutylacetonicum]
MLESLLLVSSLCIDSFVASIAYGTSKIHIPHISKIIINLVCTITLACSLLIGSILKSFLPSNLPVILGFFLLMLLGIYRLFESIFKSYISKYSRSDKPLTFKIFDFKFILQVYADEIKADFDNSKSLNIKESFYLGLALSLDSLAVGIGSSLCNVNYFEVLVLCFIIGLIAVSFGSFLGKKFAQKLNLNLSWLSGALLILLAILRVLK